MYSLHPFIPGRAGWHKLLLIEGLLAAGVLGYALASADPSWYVLDLLFMAIGLVLMIGIDFGGVTPLYKSDLDPLLDRLGVGQIGSIYFGGRAEIKRGKLTLDESKCTACGICCDVCPRGVYTVQRDGRKRVIMQYPERCERCEACVVQCPRGAISVGEPMRS
jgi:NAD-dependent dihydropyrimidine dehydrogenase PreA subunit